MVKLGIHLLNLHVVRLGDAVAIADASVDLLADTPIVDVLVHTTCVRRHN